MENIKYLSFAIVIALLINACSDDSNSTGPEPPSGEEASSEKQFVYNAMNEWYLYQADVAALADDRFANDQAKQDFLISYSSSSSLFDDLQVPQEQDPYSFFIDDYEEFEENQDGIQAATGLRYGFRGFSNSDKVVGYVRYVVEGSPADDAGLERFDVFTEVDGTSLNTQNFNSFLSDNGAHTLQLVDVELNSENQVSFTDTESVEVGSQEVIEDPIFRSTVIDTNNTQIGYLMYNSFQGNSHEDLNAVFGDFQSQGIDDLVLDLRYNGGGAVITSQLISSMISGLGSSDTFADFTYNSKNTQSNGTETFLDHLPIRDENGNYTPSGSINKLSLDRVYVLTSASTASASETLINSLLPYNIEIIQIGRQTEGKDVGSITLYDAPPQYSNKDNINPDHKKAIQPIVVKINNADGNDYPNGFTPDGSLTTEGDNHIDESSFTYLASDLNPELGNPEEVLLSRAISLITGEPMAKRLQENPRVSEELYQTKGLPLYHNIQYIEPFMMPQKK